MLRRTVLVSALAAATSAHAFSSGVPLPPVLNELSDLPLETLAHEATTLGQNLRPGPVVVSFWASWCAPCLDEARYLAAVRARYDADRLNMIGLNLEYIQNNERGVQLFLQRTRPSWTQLRASIATYHAFGGSREQLVLPRLYVFDATGRPAVAFDAINIAAANRAIEGVVRA